ncbi:arabinofuranosidase catalytic domain-containing protein [Aestuariivirga sp.]|uniref:arabinofuranosidase catalytic domain-containing protein n=1 Tax=Aestuariivirga sp. TaxID=2650926 RepID=UPI003BAC22A4
MAALCLVLAPATAATLNFTVTASEPVIVSGTPRIAIDVGGITRYATYASGSGTAALSFTFTVQAGDFDADGIALASPIERNGGSIADLASNPASNFSFSLPNTSALKVQTYTATLAAVTNSNANAASFTISKAPIGGSFTYTITTSGGANTVTGSGTISSSAHTVSGVDVSTFPPGTLTLSVTVSTSAGGTGTARTATATPSFTGVLDSLPATSAAYSLRRLRSGYTGALVRVRRSSDNTEQDIGATLAGNLNTAALASFCGSSSCFARTLYDQSGNAINAIQTNTASQPRIYAAGVTELDGAQPALRYTAFGQFLSVSIPGQTILATWNVVARNTDTTSQRHVLGDRGIAGNFGRIIRANVGGASYGGGNIGGATVNLSGAVTQQRVITILSGVTNVSGAYDGVFATGGNSSYYATSGVSMWVGGGGVGQQSTGDWIGTISEVTIFNSTLSTTNRQTLERNQGAYYGILVQ